MKKIILSSFFILSLLFVILLYGCDPTKCIDMDTDGYGNPPSAKCGSPELDCDDNNADVNPGIVESTAQVNCLNGLDDDCDGDTDSEDSDCEVDPCDVDGDGYESESCGGNDCNDENDNINPGAREIKNGFDENCNGIIDEGSLDMILDKEYSKIAGEDVTLFYFPLGLFDYEDLKCLSLGYKGVGFDTERCGEKSGDMYLLIENSDSDQMYVREEWEILGECDYCEFLYYDPILDYTIFKVNHFSSVTDNEDMGDLCIGDYECAYNEECVDEFLSGGGFCQPCIQDCEFSQKPGDHCICDGCNTQPICNPATHIPDGNCGCYPCPINQPSCTSWEHDGIDDCRCASCNLDLCEGEKDYENCKCICDWDSCDSMWGSIKNCRCGEECDDDLYYCDFDGSCCRAGDCKWCGCCDGLCTMDDGCVQDDCSSAPEQPDDCGSDQIFSYVNPYCQCVDRPCYLAPEQPEDCTNDQYYSYENPDCQCVDPNPAEGFYYMCCASDKLTCVADFKVYGSTIENLCPTGESWTFDMRQTKPFDCKKSCLEYEVPYMCCQNEQQPFDCDSGTYNVFQGEPECENGGKLTTNDNPDLVDCSIDVCPITTCTQDSECNTGEICCDGRCVTDGYSCCDDLTTECGSCTDCNGQVVDCPCPMGSKCMPDGSCCPIKDPCGGVYGQCGYFYDEECQMGRNCACPEGETCHINEYGGGTCKDEGCHEAYYCEHQDICCDGRDAYSSPNYCACVCLSGLPGWSPGCSMDEKGKGVGDCQGTHIPVPTFGICNGIGSLCKTQSC
ncbi:putative metal-binding motif-containing protein [Nanoarchaeota archaeon]